MTNNFTSVHIYNQQRLSENEIIKRLDDCFYEKDYWRVPEGESADIEFYIFYKDNERWVTAYENTLDNLDSIDLENCAEKYSSIFILPAVVAGIRNEEALFAYSDANQSHEKVLIDHNDKGGKKGFLSRFQFGNTDFVKLEPILRHKDDKDKMQKVWDTSYAHAKDQLAAFAELFDINRILITKGYKDYENEYKANNEIESKYHVIIRRYKKKDGIDIKQKDETLPVMRVVDYDKSIVQDKEYHISFKNVSASSKGISLVLFGPVIDQYARSGYRIVNLKVKYQDIDGDKKEDSSAFSIVEFTNHQKGLHAKMENVDLVRGCDLKFSFSFRNLPRSDQKMYIGVSPVSNPKEGQFVVAIEVK